MSHGRLREPTLMITRVLERALTDDMVEQLICSASDAVQEGWPSEWYGNIVHEGQLYIFDLAELARPEGVWIMEFNSRAVPPEWTASYSFGRRTPV